MRTLLASIILAAGLLAPFVATPYTANPPVADEYNRHPVAGGQIRPFSEHRFQRPDRPTAARTEGCHAQHTT